MNTWAEAVYKLLTLEERQILSEIWSYFNDHPGERTLPKYLFSKAHSKLKQKDKGITYTPEPIRVELTNFVLDELAKSHQLKDVKVCDPCCGSGLFSITLIEALEHRGIDICKAIQNNVFFGDIDPLSVAISLLNIQSYLNFRNIDCNGISPNYNVGDFLDVTQEFDAFITNPPYVKIQNMDVAYREKLRIRYPDIFNGALGLSSVFLRHMFDTLSDNGIVGVITQNNFFTSNAGKALRKYIGDHIVRVDTFGSEYIFQDVSAYTCLLYLSAKRNVNTFQYRRIQSVEDLQSIPVSIDTRKLHHSKWRLGNETEINALKRMESIGVPLGSVCRIWVGIATQFDKAFTVTKIDGKWVSSGPQGERTIIEDGIVKSLIKIADLTNEESLTRNNKGIIYPYDIFGNKVAAIDEERLIDEYPKAYLALSLWKKELMARQKGGIRKVDWYKWGRVQSMIPVDNKLLTKTFNRGPCFYHDSSDSLFSNGYALKISNPQFLLDYVRTILNSKVFEKYAKLTSFEIQGGYQCYQKNFIERFCLPILPIANQILVVNREIDANKMLMDYFDLKHDFITDE